MRYLRIILFPFSCIYGIIVFIRHFLYDVGWIKSQNVGIPTIVIGNLAVGGTGKSPMTEYLIRLLAQRYRIAILSRGYGRVTRGYREVMTDDLAKDAGDEPLQFKRKFPDITVAVCENRLYGIEQLQEKHDLVILDDAFQHRALKPGFSILLFDYKETLRPIRLLLPAGNYRDLFSRRKKADLMIVSKSPKEITAEQKQTIQDRLAYGKIPLLFSHIMYGELMPLQESVIQQISSDTTILLVTGIANPKPLLDVVSEHYRLVDHLAFADHHAFTDSDIRQIKSRFERIKTADKVIITTEKDSMRLREFSTRIEQAGLPVFYLPIRVGFEAADEDVLQQHIASYLQQHKRD